ncbi:MAG: methylmalonyl-CoA mutase family protein [Anaerolineae bacterium]
MEEIAKSKREWEEGLLSEALKRHPELKEKFLGGSGMPVERLYTPADVDLDYLLDLGFPGQHPFTRGIYPTMYRGRIWTMRQYAGYATAEETNQRFKYLLSQGQTGLSVAFDLPTQLGYDSDHPLAEGEVGKVGVAISSLPDMEVLLEGLPLDQISTSMTINATAPILLAMYIAVALEQGAAPSRLRGTTQNDILKEYVARGTYIFPPQPSMRLVTDIFAYCQQEMARWNTISISGYHMREAGATAIQEVAFTLANAIAYVEGAMAKGLAVDEFAPRLSFFFSAHNDLLEEIAKFRATRRLWARIMKERFKAEDPRSCVLRFHTQTAGSTLTAQQPENNIVRVAIQALAAVLGGTQSLHTNSMDEALALPSELAVRVALRTQQIIAGESGVTNTVDPLGGSYCLEKLTQKIEEGAQDYIDRIDDLGGAVRAIEVGFLQREIGESAYKYQREIEEGSRVIVGVNRFTSPQERPKSLLRVDPQVREKQIERLIALRKDRDGDEVRGALDELKSRAEGDGNLMPPILKCVEAHATLGEISDVLRMVFGEYKPTGSL